MVKWVTSTPAQSKWGTTLAPQCPQAIPVGLQWGHMGKETLHGLVGDIHSPPVPTRQ